MIIEKCSHADFNEIQRHIADYWGSDRTLHLHHSFLIHEFGNTAFVIKDKGTIAAYLFGFFSQTESLAYVHLIGVRQEYQRMGLGQKLYEHFIDTAKEHGCKKIKAITSPPNTQSISFHRNKIGMRLLGEPDANGLCVVKDYSGPGLDRVVFEKDI